MIKNLNTQEISTINYVKTWFNPGATTADLLDYVKTAARKKPDLVIHTGTWSQYQKLVKKFGSVVKEIDKENNVEITFQIAFIEKIAIRRTWLMISIKKLKSFCASVRFCLCSLCCGSCQQVFFNRKKLYLNRKGSSLLVKNIVSYVKLETGWYLECSDGVFRC